MSLISWRQHLHWVLFIGTKTTIRYTFCILFLLEAKIPSICPQGLILYAPNALHSNYLNSGAIKWSNRAHFIFVLKKVKIIGFGYNDHFWRHIKIYWYVGTIRTFACIGGQQEKKWKHFMFWNGFYLNNFMKRIHTLCTKL